MLERRKIIDIMECGYERPIGITYGIYTSDNKLIGTKTYLKNWYKRIKSKTKGK